MLATQLCVFDDKTDTKSKLVKKLIVITWLCCLDYYRFVKISVCDALLQFHDDPCKLTVSRLNSKNWKYVLSPSTKSTKFIITKKHKRSSAACWDHCDKIKTVKSNVVIIKYPYFAKILKFFVVNLKLLRKPIADWLFPSRCD